MQLSHCNDYSYTDSNPTPNLPLFARGVPSCRKTASPKIYPPPAKASAKTNRRDVSIPRHTHAFARFSRSNSCHLALLHVSRRIFPHIFPAQFVEVGQSTENNAGDRRPLTIHTHTRHLHTSEAAAPPMRACRQFLSVLLHVVLILPNRVQPTQRFARAKCQLFPARWGSVSPPDIPSPENHRHIHLNSVAFKKFRSYNRIML